MGKLAILKEFGSFIVTYRNWVIVPIVIALLIFGVFLIMGGTLAITPFIYAIF